MNFEIFASKFGGQFASARGGQFRRHLQDKQEFVLLTKISCKEVELLSRKSDTVVVGSYVVVV